MGKVTGFLELQRIQEAMQPARERVRHYREFTLALADAEAEKQGARCMDCGIPFCQSGCPVHNVIPDWNDLVYRHQWRDALDVLHSTNNFPEFTGRVCPAPCEASCTLNINNDPVGIKSIEHFIIDKGWDEGWVAPQPPDVKTGKRVAVIGSGPAGMACAQQLARAGHEVVLFEKADRIGGLLRYGIPDFKMEKHLIDQRMAQMSVRRCRIPARRACRRRHSGGATARRFRRDRADGRRRSAARPRRRRAANSMASCSRWTSCRSRTRWSPATTVANQIMATGKHVVIIGGGDTGSDCVGTSNRHGAASITQFELLPQPPESENKPLVWPNWPIKLRTSSSHEEGCARDWAVTTKRFEGRDGKVEKLIAARVEWQKDATGAMKMVEVPGSEFELKADLVLFAMGFVGPVQSGLLAQFGVERDARSNVKADTDSYRTSVPKVFAAGDMRRGQSLVVWAIREGRQAARAVDEFLMGTSTLPR